MTAHKTHPEVKQLLDDEQSDVISKIDHVKAFSEFKREGIRKYNRSRIAVAMT